MIVSLMTFDVRLKKKYLISFFFKAKVKHFLRYVSHKTAEWKPWRPGKQQLCNHKDDVHCQQTAKGASSGGHACCYVWIQAYAARTPACSSQGERRIRPKFGVVFVIVILASSLSS